jgi:predicted alpha/beta-fold hydrolase
MPIITSDFTASFPFTNKHFSTIYRTVFTNPKVNFTRKRIETKDGDFLDLDFSCVHSKKAAILIHGLEGSSNSKYILSTTHYLNLQNIDVIVINLRGCSGELNRYYKAYHSGETGDLDFVIHTISKEYTYEKISLVGFSLGGNVVLKYAGEQENNMDPLIKNIIAISPPCDLKGSSKQLSKKSNLIYMKRFLNTLILKATDKGKLFPEQNINLDKLLKSKNFNDFDNLYTAPSFGFKDAEDYWEKASSKPYLKKIKTPTYLLTSKNDPFLSESCFPIEEASKNPFLYLELTSDGGHIGFIKSFRSKDAFWFEKKITTFLMEK